MHQRSRHDFLLSDACVYKFCNCNCNCNNVSHPAQSNNGRIITIDNRRTVHRALLNRADCWLVLTRRNVNAGDWNTALDHSLYDRSHVRLRCRTAEAAAEQCVDDDVVGAGDEVRLGRHVRQERNVLQFALLRQFAVERRLARSAGVEDGRTIALPLHRTLSHTRDGRTANVHLTAHYDI